MCYANKDDRLTFQPYMNLKLGKKDVNYVMKNNKSEFDFKEEVKVNFESCLLVMWHFPYGVYSLLTLLYEENKDWKEYIKMSKQDCDEWDRRA